MNQKVHMIGNAHIDPVWLWNWQEGFAEIKATFKSALDRMEEFEGFIFSCAGACYYKWVEDNAPELFERIKKRVAEGRWVIVNGWWLQPDCNIPSGESFVRHALYSQRYYMEKFGRIATCGYNVDSFGHNGMLPQLLKKSGMKNYVFMRPGDHEKDLPANLFIWESKDKSRVTTFKIPFSYTTSGKIIEQRVSSVGNKIEATFTLAEKQGTDMMCFFGVGNHGGGPTIQEILKINELIDTKYGEKLSISSPDIFFNSIEPDNTPVVKGDLQHHAAGCYSANSHIKQLNNKAELRLEAAEKANFLAKTVLGDKSFKEQIKKAWENVMFNQFHDILCGCSIEEAYDDAYEFYGHSLSISAKILNHSLQRLSWEVDTSKNGLYTVDKSVDGKLWMHEENGVPLVIFNTHSHDVETPVVLQQELECIEDDSGIPLPVQKIRASRTNGENDKYGTLLFAKIPAMGYKLFWGYKSKKNDFVQKGFATAFDNVLENDCYKVVFDQRTGHIKSMYDKFLAKETFESFGCIPVVVDESSCDTWSHGIFEFRNDVGFFENAKIHIMEKGPLRAMVRVEYSYNNSVLRQDFYLYAGKKYLYVKARIIMLEKHKMLKMSFPFAASNCNVTSGIAYGFIEKKCDGQEEPFQKWVAVKGDDDFALSVVVSGKYAYDAKDNDLRLTCLRTPVFADHFGVRDRWCEYSDIGENKFEYLISTDSDVRPEKLTASACEFNTPPVAVAETFHKGSLPSELKTIDIDKENVTVTVLKECEDNEEDYIVRMVETAGKQTLSSLNLPVIGRRIYTEFNPCEIKTFLIPKDINKKVYEVDLIERFVKEE